MARRTNDPTGADRAKVRILFAEVEGNNETVQEALSTMVSAMGRPARVIQLKANSETPALTQEELYASVNEEIWDGDDVDASKESSQSETNSRRKPRGSGQKIDRNASIKLVPDLNFRPEGQPTLKEFFAEKAPRTDMEEILVVLYFMQHMMGISKIGLGHIRTALQDVGKSIPLDLAQTVRNMRAKKAWVQYSKLDDITTATVGENYVRHDMANKS